MSDDRDYSLDDEQMRVVQQCATTLLVRSDGPENMMLMCDMLASILIECAFGKNPHLYEIAAATHANHVMDMIDTMRAGLHKP